MNIAATTLNRPDAKRKLLVALIFTFSYGLSVAEVGQDGKSITAWGSLLSLTLMAISAWPLVKDFIWPSGSEYVAATELSLACHSWKNGYFRVDRDLLNRISKADGENVWEKMLSASRHECTPENLSRFRTLFFDEALNTLNRIDAVIIRYGDVLPEDLRVLAQQAMNQLSLAPFSYTMLGRLDEPYSEQAFYVQFVQVINALSKLETPAHELQNRTKRG